MRLSKIFLLSTFLLLWLGGCAIKSFDAIVPGMSREEVVSRLGQPGAIIAHNSGTRLQYSGQPAGQFAFMVDLDASGHVLNVKQALNARNFERIEPGKWTRDDVLREFGRPASVDHVAMWQGDILTYRWLDVHDMFYWIYLDLNQVVQKAHPGMEFRGKRERRL